MRRQEMVMRRRSRFLWRSGLCTGRSIPGGSTICPLADTDEKARRRAVEDHKKWVEAARFLGCRTVRVNLHGHGSSQEKRSASVDSLGRLGDFAQTMGINVVVENHGHESSNGAWLASVIKQCEGPTPPEDEGIRNTKHLLEKYL